MYKYSVHYVKDGAYTDRVEAEQVTVHEGMVTFMVRGNFVLAVPVRNLLKVVKEN